MTRKTAFWLGIAALWLPAAIVVTVAVVAAGFAVGEVAGRRYRSEPLPMTPAARTLAEADRLSGGANDRALAETDRLMRGVPDRAPPLTCTPRPRCHSPLGCCHVIHRDRAAGVVEGPCRRYPDCGVTVTCESLPPCDVAACCEVTGGAWPRRTRIVAACGEVPGCR